MPTPPCSSLRSRLDEVEKMLNSETINLRALSDLCFNGIPDENSHRSVCWRVLLHYLPLRTSEWKDFLNKQRSFYSSLIEDLIVSPSDSCKPEAVEADHPLSQNPTSVWSSFFRDNEVLAQIDKDVRRLCPEISFFQQPTPFPCSAIVENRVQPLCQRVARTMLESEAVTRTKGGATKISRKFSVEEYQTLPQGQEAHWEVVERILFLYSKLNPGVKYVQGMNEVLGPIYYVFASDTRTEWKEYAEADAFFCFQNLMSEIKDYFIKTLDRSICGIERTMGEFYNLLNEHDPKVYNLMHGELELLPQYYAFRWISLLLSQEFLLPDVIRIWDSLFADEHRFQFLLYMCIAMVISKREEILTGDFTSIMKLLQNYTVVDVGDVLAQAAQLYETRKV